MTRSLPLSALRVSVSVCVSKCVCVCVCVCVCACVNIYHSVQVCNKRKKQISLTAHREHQQVIRPIRRLGVAA